MAKFIRIGSKVFNLDSIRLINLDNTNNPNDPFVVLYMQGTQKDELFKGEEALKLIEFFENNPDVIQID